MSFTPYQHQIDAQDIMLRMEREGKGGFLADSMGLGKCVHPDTKIPLWKGGFKLAKDIVEGDLLIGDDSTPRTVLSSCSGNDMMYTVHQHKGENYTVNEPHILSLKVSGHKGWCWYEKKHRYHLNYFDRETNDFRTKSFGVGNKFQNIFGSKDEALQALLIFRESISDIEWSSEYRDHKQYVWINAENKFVLKHKVGDKLTSTTFRVTDMADIFKSKEEAYNAMMEFRVSISDDDVLDIPVVDYLQLNKRTRAVLKGFKVGVDFPEQDVFLDPYVLGAWLGGFTNIDDECLDYFRALMTDMECDMIQQKDNNPYFRISGTRRYTITFIQTLDFYNLRNNKHIPTQFLINSREIRLAVLAGLIDTDGYGADCSYEITNKNERLANDIAYLARSLGFFVNIKPVQKSCMYKGEKQEGTYFKCVISGNGLQEVPVLIPKKKLAVRAQKKDEMVTSITIEQVGVGKYCGFTLDGNRRFLLHDFTVTHNTLTMALFLKNNFIIGKKTLIVCPYSIMKTWEREINRVYKDEDMPKILIYHGPKRIREFEEYKCDFIITTYAILGTGELKYKRWGRVVLDESHYIKNGLLASAPKCAKAAFEVGKISMKNWCISGTPFNNRMKDLASQCKFIGTAPYNDPSWWKDHKNDEEALVAWRDKFVLQRTKEGMLEKPIYHDIEVEPRDRERDLVDALRAEAAQKFRQWKRAQGVDKIKLQAIVLTLIQRLRIVSNSFYSGQGAIDTDQVIAENAKVDRIINDIDNQIFKDKKKGVVVFSQFTSFLSVLEQVIEEKMVGVEVLKFTGSMDDTERDEVVKYFNESRHPRVILVSLMAGGVGLSLHQGSSSLFLSEPYYNPFVEQQAEDRVNRLGQENQVEIFRYTMINSVETWMSALKLRKLGIASSLSLVKKSDVPVDFSFEDVAELFYDHVSFTNRDNENRKKKTTEEDKEQVTEIKDGRKKTIKPIKRRKPKRSSRVPQPKK